MDLSQENIVEESNFNPENVVQLYVEYTFAEVSNSRNELSIEQLQIISFAGCKLAGNCPSRMWH